MAEVRGYQTSYTESAVPVATISVIITSLFASNLQACASDHPNRRLTIEERWTPQSIEAHCQLVFFLEVYLFG